MKYPEFLKQGDTIGICALSCGIVEEDDIKRLDEAKENLKNMGYKVLETAHVRTQEGGASTDAKTRVDVVDIDWIYPLSWTNKEVTECAFGSVQYVRGQKYIVLALLSLKTTKK